MEATAAAPRGPTRGEVRAQAALERLKQAKGLGERVEVVDERPPGSPPLNLEVLRVIVTAEGKLVVPDHSLLRDLDREGKARVLEAILERRALAGDLNAIALRLAHYRWTVEMEKGRAAAQVHHTHSGSVTIVDDLDEAPRNIEPHRKARKALAAPQHGVVEAEIIESAERKGSDESSATYGGAS